MQKLIIKNYIINNLLFKKSIDLKQEPFIGINLLKNLIITSDKTYKLVLPTLLKNLSSNQFQIRFLGLNMKKMFSHKFNQKIILHYIGVKHYFVTFLGKTKIQNLEIFDRKFNLFSLKNHYRLKISMFFYNFDFLNNKKHFHRGVLNIPFTSLILKCTTNYLFYLLNPLVLINYLNQNLVKKKFFNQILKNFHYNLSKNLFYKNLFKEILIKIRNKNNLTLLDYNHITVFLNYYSKNENFKLENFFKFNSPYKFFLLTLKKRNNFFLGFIGQVLSKPTAYFNSYHFTNNVYIIPHRLFYMHKVLAKIVHIFSYFSSFIKKIKLKMFNLFFNFFNKTYSINFMVQAIIKKNLNIFFKLNLINLNLFLKRFLKLKIYFKKFIIFFNNFFYFKFKPFIHLYPRISKIIKLILLFSKIFQKNYKFIFTNFFNEFQLKRLKSADFFLSKLSSIFFQNFNENFNFNFLYLNSFVLNNIIFYNYHTLDVYRKSSNINSLFEEKNLIKVENDNFNKVLLKKKIKKINNKIIFSKKKQNFIKIKKIIKKLRKIKKLKIFKYKYKNKLNKKIYEILKKIYQKVPYNLKTLKIFLIFFKILSNLKLNLYLENFLILKYKNLKIIKVPKIKGYTTKIKQFFLLCYLFIIKYKIIKIVLKTFFNLFKELLNFSINYEFYYPLENKKIDFFKLKNNLNNNFKNRKLFRKNINNNLINKKLSKNNYKFKNKNDFNYRK